MNDLWCYDVAAEQWEWVSGSSTERGTAYYDGQGEEDGDFVPDAARAAASCQHSHYLYLFGGQTVQTGEPADLSGLWRFNLVNREWSMLYYTDSNSAGQTDPDIMSNNWPGSRRSAAITIDATGDYLYMLGGHGYSLAGGSGALGDLWKFNLANYIWTFVSGETVQDCLPSNSGLNQWQSNGWGCREGHSMDYDPAINSLLIFGGRVQNTYYRNDVWLYDLSQGVWAWIAGSSTDDPPSSVGSSEFSIDNAPSGKAYFAHYYVADPNVRLLITYGGRKSNGKRWELYFDAVYKII